MCLNGESEWNNNANMCNMWRRIRTCHQVQDVRREILLRLWRAWSEVVHLLSRWRGRRIRRRRRLGRRKGRVTPFTLFLESVITHWLINFLLLIFWIYWKCASFQLVYDCWWAVGSLDYTWYLVKCSDLDGVSHNERFQKEPPILIFFPWTCSGYRV